jgi:hypothetical protein
MADVPTERERLQQDLRDVEQELARLMRRYNTAVTNLGPVTIKAHLPPLRVFKLFIGFHVVTAFGGATMILRGSGRVGDLGIALVVGALFGIGRLLGRGLGSERGPLKVVD